VRGSLIGIALGLAAVFAIARWLDPFGADGSPLLMGTHRQIGLPPCTFYTLTGLPCPSCGMTTSFALLVRGDVVDSLQANAVGTLLAVCCLAFIPWSLACVVRGRWLAVEAPLRILSRFLIAFVVLLLARWGVVLALWWLK
jgi:hypothetical protein